MKLLGGYKNGNYNVLMYDDGTKIRVNDTDHFEPDFPESIDMKISNKCHQGCQFCHECSTPDGKLANLNHPILNNLHPYTELALGGGDPLEHPDLIPFLTRMRDQKIICNMTVHLNSFCNQYHYIKELIDGGLIHGLGISVTSTISDKEIQLIETIPNAVVHVIAGIISMETLEKMSNHNLKLLILGYKDYGRGADFFNPHYHEIDKNIQQIESALPKLREGYKIISFDNLALVQLRMGMHIPATQWEKYYMGNDGEYTMYIDLVEETYARSSVCKRVPFTSVYVDYLFNNIRSGFYDAQDH